MSPEEETVPAPCPIVHRPNERSTVSTSMAQQFPTEYPSDEDYERWKADDIGLLRGRNNYPVLPSESNEARLQNNSMARAMKDEV